MSETVTVTEFYGLVAQSEGQGQLLPLKERSGNGALKSRKEELKEKAPPTRRARRSWPEDTIVVQEGLGRCEPGD